MKRKKSTRAKNHTSQKVNTKQTRNFHRFVAFGCVSVFVAVIAVISTIKILERTTSSIKKFNLPELYISLHDAPIEQINMDTKDIKYNNNAVNFVTQNSSANFTNVTIKGRGNSTWLLPKKPYQLKFPTKVNLLGNDEKGAKKWILLANYLDHTHIRNDTAFYIAKLLDKDYPISGTFTELYIDDNYNGLYYITEKIEIDDSRVNLSRPGGIIAEIDNLYGTNEDCSYTELSHTCIVFEDSVLNDLSSEQKDAFIKSYNLLESAVAIQDYPTIASIIDIDSFVEYFLLSEFTVNPDAYSSSFFIYRDGEDDLIHAGPGWDYDYAFGNREWSDPDVDYDSFHSPFNTTILKSYIDTDIDTRDDSSVHFGNTSTIIYDLLEIPKFAQRVMEIYQQTLSNHQDDILDHIRTTADQIRAAALRDANRWKFTTNYDNEVDYFIDWVSKRLTHFEETYGATEANARAKLDF